MFHKSSLSNQYLSVLIRKQPPEVFCQGGCFGGFRGVRWRVLVRGSLFFIELQALGLIGMLLRKCFSVGFVGFLGASFLQSTSGRLLLLIPLSYSFHTLLYFS